jgi:SAM-dependent methyltransferase
METTASFDPERYWSTRLERTYSLAGVGWLGLSESFNRWMYAVRRRVFRRTVRGHVDMSRARVLDVGSGTGFYVDLWQALGAGDVTGCDLTTFAVERLRSRFPNLHFERVDISATTPVVVEGPYDAISAMDVLFHIVDDEGYAQALQNLGELLALDGVLVITENLPHGATLRTEHQASRSLDTVIGLLREAGLEVVSRRPLFVLMNTPVDSQSTFLRIVFPRVFALARGRVSGWLVGALLYPLELALTRLLREGPTTEIVVCRRSAGVG